MESPAPRGAGVAVRQRRPPHQAVEWLRRYRRSEAIQEDPFFLCVATAPHHPYGVPNDVWAMYEDRETPEPSVGLIPFEELDNAHDRWLAQALTLDKQQIPPDVALRNCSSISSPILTSCRAG